MWAGGKKEKIFTFTLVSRRRERLCVAPFAGHAAVLWDTRIVGVTPVAPLELQRDVCAATTGPANQQFFVFFSIEKQQPIENRSKTTTRISLGRK